MSFFGWIVIVMGGHDQIFLLCLKLLSEVNAGRWIMIAFDGRLVRKWDEYQLLELSDIPKNFENNTSLSVRLIYETEVKLTDVLKVVWDTLQYLNW